MSDPIIGDVDTPPRLNYPFLWADFIELRCLIHPDKIFTRADIDDVFQEKQDQSRDSEFKADVDSVEIDKQNGYEADKADRRSRKWGDCFKMIRRRVMQYGKDYPFNIDSSSSKIILRSPLTSGMRMYLMSLIASSMRYIPDTRRGEIAGAFEAASYSVFKRLMPPGARIYIFGAGNNGRSRYRGHLHTRLKKLARDFRGQLITKKKDFARIDRGDGGIDLLAWHPMLDSRDGIPLALAQCGCSPDEWVHKQLEASPSKLRQLHVLHDWASYYFMPHDLMDKEGDWFRASDIGKAIIVDRIRMVRLSRQYDSFDEAISGAAFVDEAIALSIP